LIKLHKKIQGKKMIDRKKANILMDEVYENQIIRTFNSWIKNYCKIDCFAILLILPNNEMLHLSTHSLLTKIYQGRNYGLYDQPVSKIFYENLPFYSWQQPRPNKIQREIHQIREKIFNLNSGTNFVRKIDTEAGRFHIIYCVSTYENDPLHYFKFTYNVNKILEICDFSYNTLLPIFQENCANFILPRIDKFIGFDYKEILSLFKDYNLQNELANRVISFIEQSNTETETEYKIKLALQLTINNSNTCLSSRRKFAPYLIKG